MIFEILITVLLVVLLSFLCIFEWPSLRTMKLMKKFDGLSGTFFFGHTFLIMKLKTEALLDFVGTVCAFGPSCKVWFLGMPFLVINDVEYIEALLSSVNYIKKGVMYELFQMWLNEGLLLSKGAKWHYRRKLLTPAFHFKILEDCLPIFNRNAREMVDDIIENYPNEVVTLENHISKCTLFIICEAAMGIPLSKLSDKGEYYVKATRKISNMNMKRAVTPWLLRDWLFNLTPMGREYGKVVKELHSFTDMVIKERQEQRLMVGPGQQLKYGKSRPRTFLDCLLEVNEENASVLSIEDIREEVNTFMFEGHDTTSAAITATLFMLGHHQQIQEIVIKELDDVFGESSREPTLEDLNNLDYLDRVIKETLRLYPSVPGMLRQIESDLKLSKDLIVPATTNVIFCPYWLHRHPKLYPDPEKFDPDRFLPEEVKNRHPFAYIPFSGGPRNCIGQKFAKLELKVVLSTILRKVRVESVTKLDDVIQIPSVILRPLNPYKIKFIPR